MAYSHSTPKCLGALPSAVVVNSKHSCTKCGALDYLFHMDEGEAHALGKLCVGSGVAILSITSLPHLHNHCAPNNASRNSQRTQMCSDIFIFGVKKDERGKLEAPPFTSLLFWMFGIKVGKLDALPFCIVLSPEGKLDILPFLCLHHQSLYKL
eukprot:14870875-Ditylum_brightwellii.AAC.1